MDDLDPRLVEVFFEVQRGLPRQGPGSNNSTAKALALCSELPANAAILDIGCGPGMQTLALAASSGGSIVAVDNCDEYLEELRQRIDDADLSERVKTKNADMTTLGFPEGTFDLIWCEGAAYILGVPEAVRAWRRLLRDGGYLAFTDLVWLEEHPAPEVAKFFAREYPAMTNVTAINKTVRENGYEPIADFTLPDSAWFDDYYTPLEAKLPALKRKYEGDDEALALVAMTEAEIDMRRRYGQSYGYQFFVARKGWTGRDGN